MTNCRGESQKASRLVEALAPDGGGTGEVDATIPGSGTGKAVAAAAPPGSGKGETEVTTLATEFLSERSFLEERREEERKSTSERKSAVPSKI